MAADPWATAATLAELKTEVEASIADVRRLVYDLRPRALDQPGAGPALQEYAALLGERCALAIFVSAPALPPLPAAVEVGAYRIATEALTNAVRHSGARRTSVSFTVADAQLRLEVADDGVGHPPSAAAAAPASILPRWLSAQPNSAAPSLSAPPAAVRLWWPCCPCGLAS